MDTTEEKKNKWDESKFNKRIRIRDSQLKYLDSIRGTYTKAGKLDEIINFYKKYEENNYRNSIRSSNLTSVYSRE